MDFIGPISDADSRLRGSMSLCILLAVVGVGSEGNSNSGGEKKTLSYALKEPSVHLLKTSLVQGGEHQKKDFGIEET